MPLSSKNRYGGIYFFSVQSYFDHMKYAFFLTGAFQFVASAAAVPFRECCSWNAAEAPGIQGAGWKKRQIEMLLF
jgi:hypothetical protein